MTTLHDFHAKALNGADVDLAQYAGKLVLVVNTASKCGLTPQFKGLQELQDTYGDRGLVVLGFPCNQFAGQEPGTEAEIKAFCEVKFDIDFPMTAKADVKGDSRHPFYAWAEEKLGEGAVPVWNFHKILIGADGEAVAAFGPRTEPQDESITSAVKAAL